MKSKILLSILLALPMLVNANYDANFRGKITDVLTYTNTDLILLRVTGQPTSHLKCTRFDYLAIDENMPAERRQVILSRILMAYATGESVNIGYDSKDECISGDRIKVYRVG